MRRGESCLWGLLALILIGGCASEEIEPKFNMEDKTVAVLPFKDRDVAIGPTRESILLTRLVAMDILNNNLDDIEVRPPDAVEQFFESRDIRKMGTQQIGVALGVDYVILGEIYRFDTQGDTIGLISGVFHGMVRVHDVDKGMTVYEKPLSVQYPSVPTTGLTEDFVEQRLLLSTASKIGRLFYHHEPSDEGWEIQ